MILPSDGADEASYEVPRGTCPSCGSGSVIHLVIGMPSGPDVMDGAPEWVQWVGCVHPGYNRECSSCGVTWTFTPDGPQDQMATPAEWLTMMSDALLAQSAIDRLTSGAHTLVIEGPSYRQRDQHDQRVAIDHQSETL